MEFILYIIRLHLISRNAPQLAWKSQNQSEHWCTQIHKVLSFIIDLHSNWDKCENLEVSFINFDLIIFPTSCTLINKNVSKLSRSLVGGRLCETLNILWLFFLYLICCDLTLELIASLSRLAALTRRSALILCLFSWCLRTSSN